MIREAPVAYPTKEMQAEASAQTMIGGETKTIQVLRCRYVAPCRVKGCTAQATTILRGLDSSGRHTIAWEVCTPHSDQAIAREARKGRVVVRLWTSDSG